ncbi:alpha/beta hydrolase [Microbacterium sp.]|uniref:alpha/beta hydrolase n=1 Tax=Microbacterium sp. TaxID=51671 RepID=UPI002619E47C|nr:alpha/beta hydrolase [Microbacterium sp.]
MLLFLHGAGGFDEDRSLAAALAEELGVELTMPRLPDEDMSFEGWAAPVRQALSERGVNDLVAAHSFSGSILVRVLAERDWSVRRALLLAMPNWGIDGWDVGQYDLDGAEPPQEVTLHHCVDDEVVPFAHLALNSAQLPSAGVRVHARGGHQFDGQAAALLS